MYLLIHSLLIVSVYLKGISCLRCKNMNITYTLLQRKLFWIPQYIEKREREREREGRDSGNKNWGEDGKMHLWSRPKFESRIINDNHGIYRAQNDHNFRDISRKHDTCLDNLREQILVSHYFCRAFLVTDDDKMKWKCLWHISLKQAKKTFLVKF